MDDRWLVLELDAPADEVAAAAAVSELLALGGSAVEEVDDTLRTHVRPPADGTVETLTAEATRRLERAVGGPVRLQWRWQPDLDWSREWKRGLGPRRIGRHIVVAPSWTEAQVGPGDVAIRVDPEMAFGTGEHATTRGALRLLEDTLRPGDRVLDVGTGTGILSIAAVKLGSGPVLALEADARAAATARANLSRNGVAASVRLEAVSVDSGTLSRLGAGRFDLILANVLSGVLVPLLPAFQQALAAGGRAILSGILASESADVSRAARAAGLDATAEDREDEWWSVRLSRR